MRKLYIRYFNWQLRQNITMRLLLDFVVNFISVAIAFLIIEFKYDIILYLTLALIVAIVGTGKKYFYPEDDDKPIAEEAAQFDSKENKRFLLIWAAMTIGVILVVFGVIKLTDNHNEYWFIRIPAAILFFYILASIAQIQKKNKELITNMSSGKTGT